MSRDRKVEIVRTVLSRAKGITMLHGEKLVQHVASSITLYEKNVPEKDKQVGS